MVNRSDSGAISVVARGSQARIKSDPCIGCAHASWSCRDGGMTVCSKSSENPPKQIGGNTGPWDNSVRCEHYKKLEIPA